MTTIVGGVCNCGTEVRRELAQGFGAELLNSLPFTCAPCSERKEAEWAESDRQERERVDRDRLA